MYIMFKRRKLTHDYHNRLRQESLSRSKLLTHPLLGRLSLRSQLGDSACRPLLSNPSEDVAAFYAASLSENAIYDSELTVPGFVVDESNGAIIFARTHKAEGNDTLHCLRPARPGHYRGAPHVFEAMPNTFDDMSISLRTRKLLYASTGPRGTRIVLLDVPKGGDDPHSSVVNHVWDFSEETTWQTAASPTGESFAVASTSGLSLYQMLPGRLSRISWVNVRDPASSEFLSVAFGWDYRLTMAGKRSGVVTFFDARTQGSVARLQHEDGVGAIRKIDDNRIVVRGLQKVCYWLPDSRSGGVGAIPSITGP